MAQDASKKELDAECQESETHDKMKRKRERRLDGWTAQYKRTKIGTLEKNMIDVDRDMAEVEENLRSWLKDFYDQDTTKAALQTFQSRIALPAASERVKVRCAIP